MVHFLVEIVGCPRNLLDSLKWPLVHFQVLNTELLLYILTVQNLGNFTQSTDLADNTKNKEKLVILRSIGII